MADMSRPMNPAQYTSPHTEPFTIKAAGRTWTRDTKAAAVDLADWIIKHGLIQNDGPGKYTRLLVREAVVTLTETGYVEYIASREQLLKAGLL